MRLNPTPQFKKDVSRLTQRIQQQLKKKLELLLRDARHPSLRTRKIKGEVLGFRNVFEEVSQRITGFCFVEKVMPTYFCDVVHIRKFLVGSIIL